MDAGPEYTNTCACGWTITGSEDVVVDATIDHGKRIHNMDATREQVLAVLHAGASGSDQSTDAEAAAG